MAKKIRNREHFEDLVTTNYACLVEERIPMHARSMHLVLRILKEYPVPPGTPLLPTSAPLEY